MPVRRTGSRISQPGNSGKKFQEETVSLPEIVTREEWLAARTELLAREKEQTRQRDALNADRRRLPMVEITKDYTFAGPDGCVSLADLFEGRSQLIVQHVMFDPDWDAACPGCTAALDEVAPAMLRHLESRETSFAGVSRAPYPKLAAYQAARGWQFGWYSSNGSDFNYDFDATVDASVKPPVYNYRSQAGRGEDAVEGEVPGFSCFLRDGDRIFHTYSAWARGTDTVGSAYSLLDMTAFGRSEDWEEPKGRAAKLHGADPTFRD
jgi:predicted dithiol-disulfide oxidoreductase (DUF899 family)